MASVNGLNRLGLPKLSENMDPEDARALRSRGGDPGGRLGGDAAAGFEGTTVGGWYRPAGRWYAAPGNAGGGAGQLTGQ